MLSKPKIIESKPLRCGVLIVGSLLWDKDELGIRESWRQRRLQLSAKVNVKAALNYGRKSSSWNNAYTMTIGTGEQESRAVLVPCSMEVHSLDDLMNEARELWRAEEKTKDLSDPFRKRWGCVGALFGVRAVETSMPEQWESKFRETNEESRAAIDQDGKLKIGWPLTLGGEPVTDYDIILATATKPDLEMPTAAAIAHTWLSQGGERYFFENVRHGIRTPDDLDIWAIIEAEKPNWLKAEKYVEAVTTLRCETFCRSRR